VVLPLGDSITEGFGAGPTAGSSTPYGGYRLELFRQAVAENKSLTFVGSLKNGPTTLSGKTFPQNHEGHGGFTISGISGDITNKAMTNYKPHIVLLMIGTNDINGGGDAATAPDRLKSLINSIITASSTTLVVVSSIIPIDNTGNQKVKTYNASVKSLADDLAKSGKHVVFLDNYAAFTADASFRTKWMFDYLHPNETGYTVLGKSWYSVIGPLVR
jgi:lysophospholipase L1-like esterase